MTFTAQALDEVDDRRMHELGMMLGTYWTRESVRAAFTQKPGQRKVTQRSELLLPLLLAQNPKLEDYLLRVFGLARGIDVPDWYHHVASEDVTDGFDMSPERFIRTAQMFTPLVPAEYLEQMKKKQ